MARADPWRAMKNPWNHRIHGYLEWRMRLAQKLWCGCIFRIHPIATTDPFRWFLSHSSQLYGVWLEQPNRTNLFPMYLISRTCRRTPSVERGSILVCSSLNLVLVIDADTWTLLCELMKNTPCITTFIVSSNAQNSRLLRIFANFCTFSRIDIFV